MWRTDRSMISLISSLSTQRSSAVYSDTHDLLVVVPPDRRSSCDRRTVLSVARPASHRRVDPPSLGGVADPDLGSDAIHRGREAERLRVRDHRALELAGPEAAVHFDHLVAQALSHD